MKNAALHIAATASVVVLAACSESSTPTAPAWQASRQIATYEIEDLGTFGTGYAQAFGINDPGVVIGRYGNPLRSFSWTERTGFTDLGDFNGTPFEILRHNNRGDMTGWVLADPALPADGLRPVLRRRDGSFQFIDDADHRGSAWGINEAGTVVGSRNLVGARSHAFVWTAQDGMTEILSPVGGNSTAVAINNVGQVVGSITVQLGPVVEQGFLWDAANGLTLIPNLGGSFGGGMSVNERGEVAGTSDLRPPARGERRGSTGIPGDVPAHAFYWSAAQGITDLGTLGGKHSVAWAIDQFGNVYGWANNAAGETRSFKWTRADGMTDLGSLPGGNFAQTGGVNHRGIVAAQSSDAAGVKRAVLYLPR